MRIGIGYDVHKLKKGRELHLGGVHIPHEKGLLGHSDADVLLHAIIDSMIGALGVGSIGDYFPDYDPAYKDISSLELLSRTHAMIRRSEYTIANIDCTVVCQEPRLGPYIDQMCNTIAQILHLGKYQINIKAKTEEGLGFTGKKQGISAYAVCLIHRKV